MTGGRTNLPPAATRGTMNAVGLRKEIKAPGEGGMEVEGDAEEERVSTQATINIFLALQ